MNFLISSVCVGKKFKEEEVAKKLMDFSYSLWQIRDRQWKICGVVSGGKKILGIKFRGREADGFMQILSRCVQTE